jgi:hypothetical protein
MAHFNLPLEYWSTGVMGKERQIRTIANTPILHYSTAITEKKYQNIRIFLKQTK